MKKKVYDIIANGAIEPERAECKTNEIFEILELSERQKEILRNYVSTEFKRTQSYSVAKSRNLIEIAIKTMLGCDFIQELKAQYHSFYNNDYEL